MQRAWIGSSGNKSDHFYIKFQAHGLAVFLLSIGSWIKNCDLTFGESLGSPPFSRVQLGFCLQRVDQSKKRLRQAPGWLSR